MKLPDLHFMPRSTRPKRADERGSSLPGTDRVNEGKTWFSHDVGDLITVELAADGYPYRVSQRYGLTCFVTHRFLTYRSAYRFYSLALINAETLIGCLKAELDSEVQPPL